MEVVKVNGDILEVQEFSVDQIIDKVSIENEDENKQWLEDLVKNLLKGNTPVKQDGVDVRCCYLFWKRNGKAIGFSYLHQKGRKAAAIYFEIFEGAELSPESLQALLEASIEKSFNLYSLDKILFDCGDKCSTGVPRAFIKHFQPHPVGWVHLNDGKYVLTRGKYERTEEEFYKM